MRNSVVLLAVLGLACIGEQSLRAQTATTAVVTDPLVDAKYPPGLAGITIPSHGRGHGCDLLSCRRGGTARNRAPAPRAAGV
jgi:hypothetical protein